MAFQEIDETGNESQTQSLAKINAMLRELYERDVSDKPEIAELTAIATADATDEASAVTLANATKAKVNSIIAALKA